jgi:hypothetical protein
MSIVALLLLFIGAACSEDGNQSNAVAEESERRDSAYESAVEQVPARTMEYPMTRHTIDFWLETWDEPGRLAYVYIQDMNGDYGYFVFEGMPVPYCVTLAPPYEVHTSGSGSRTAVVVPAPAMDHTYPGDGDCTIFYGKDATTGQFMQFSIGVGQNYFLYTEPMPHAFEGAVPRGDTTIEDLEE